LPELPEVETIRADLAQVLEGRTLRAVERASADELRRPWETAWHEQLAGRRIEHVRRRGKWIVLSLDRGAALLVHLGMTGQLTAGDADRPRETHTHLVFTLDDGSQLRFRDARRFGSVTLFADSTALETFFRDNGLGPEPWDLDAKAWRQALAATTRCLKAALLDQTLVAGVGNIYADEALFTARLHPARRACDLSAAEATRLRKAVQTVLTRAIECRGSSIRDYVGGSGLRGGYQDEFLVYGRTGEPCARCQTPIARDRLAGRSSHYCPECQRSV
jgi:formamidopyrimidine-DNA glycosylase